MPFYQMFCIAAHNRDYTPIKELARQCGLHVMNAGGVVRGFRYWGTQTLPQRTRRNKIHFNHGDYWTMHFDASPTNQRSLARILRKDPRVIRATMLKLGEKIEDVASHSEKTVSNPIGYHGRLVPKSQIPSPAPPSRF
ncbi:hypothetical protein FA95DRAFT_1554742 [Auriscalpium vulgare]|uniref:Uncharacterized protein n=1 Tax=Auriscalpium vulgare TaxID=40419 RepID=A0ACB8S486_9AGAM|nr:hypothetical protein FA95DRAFT_1554742 [Auriscalpium vulgare]